MKKFLPIILALTSMLLILVSCDKKNDMLNYTSASTIPINMTPTVSTTEQIIYFPEPDYANKYDGYIMTAGKINIQTGYIPKSERKSVSSVPSNREKTFDFNGTQYILTYHSSEIGYYEDYTVDSYLACHPDCDCKNPIRDKTFSFLVDVVRRTGQVVGLWTYSHAGYEGEDFCLDEMEEKKEYTEEELTEYAKKMAKVYIEKFGLDMNVDECVLRTRDYSSTMKWYYFHKCLDGVPTNEYIRIDVNQFGKFMGAQTSGVGMYEEFSNAKIDMESIKSGINRFKDITLLNDEGTLVAEVESEIYVEYTAEEQDLGYPPARWESHTTYIPLVAKEIENKE